MEESTISSKSEAMTKIVTLVMMHFLTFIILELEYNCNGNNNHSLKYEDFDVVMQRFEIVVHRVVACDIIHKLILKP